MATNESALPLSPSFSRLYFAACRIVHAYNPRAVSRFAWCFLLMLCAAAMAASLPYLLGKAIDSFQLGNAAFWMAPVAYCIVWSAQKLLTVVNGLVAAIFSTVAHAAMVQAIFNHRVTSFQPKERSIELGAELATIDRAEGSFGQITHIVFMTLGALAIEVLIGLVVFASKVDFAFALCVALGLTILLWTAIDVGKRSSKAHRIMFSAHNDWQTWLTHGLEQARWARMYGAQVNEFKQAKLAAVAYSLGFVKANRVLVSLHLYQVLVAILFFGSIAAYLIFAQPNITGGVFATLTGYALQMVLPMSQTAHTLTELQGAKLALGDVELPEADDHGGKESHQPASQRSGPTTGDVLQIEGFRAYASERSIDARIELNGALYAIKGESGAGKSCLLEALIGAFGEYAGSVSLNRADIRDMPFEQLVRCACYVPAAPIIINDRSFRDNLLWGLDRAVSDADLQASMVRLKLAPYHELDDVLGREGRALSSGEAQRLNLARALLRQPALLLLDEPTANLDQESRAIVIEMVREANATVIVATHDPELLAAAQRVFEFERRDAAASCL